MGPAAEAVAAFAHAEVTAGRLTLTRGLRLETIRLWQQNFGRNGPDRTGAEFSERENVVNVVIPGIAGRYAVTTTMNVLAGVHRGFAPPSAQEGVSPETSLNYELGLRYDSPRLAGQVTAFLNDYDNVLGSDLAVSDLFLAWWACREDLRPARLSGPPRLQSPNDRANMPASSFVRAACVVALAYVATAAPLQAQSAECTFRSHVHEVHLSPGETSVVDLGVVLRTDADPETMPPYEWSTGAVSLVSLTPSRGTARFTAGFGEPLLEEPGTYFALISMTMTAGPTQGAEMISVNLTSTDKSAVPFSCEGAIVPLGVSVGGGWGLTAHSTIEDRMTVIGTLIGSFSLGEGDTVTGGGFSRATVLGACLRGVSDGRFLIEGTVEDDVIHLTILEDWDHDPGEPEILMDPSAECMIRTMRDLPSAMRALANWAGGAMTDKKCRMEVPLEAAYTSFSCGDLRYRVVRNQ